MTISVAGWASAAMSPLAPIEPSPANPQRLTPAKAPAAERLLEQLDEQPWSSEPAWLRQPNIGLHAQDLPETRPEPIPLPPAVMAGPIFLTSILAGAMMKKRRRTARRW